MSDELYVLTLNKEQALLTRDALELYARLKIGQFTRITELMLDVRDVKDYCERRDTINDLFRVIAGLFFGRNSYGQPDCKKDAEHHRAWNIYTALRYQIAWHDNPKGGIGCCYDEPRPWGGEPVPRCEIIT